MSIRVESKVRCKGVGAYVGRPSALGNPFTHKQAVKARHPELVLVGSREEAVACYERWLRAELAKGNRRVREAMNSLWRRWREDGELVLVCWCAPKACHADVLKRVLEETLAKRA